MENLTGRRAQISGWGRSKWAGLALVGCVFALAAALSWRRWPDILVDFGIQLYLPWRISAGDVLYRDMMYLTGGPLSQYFNALLFKVFGVSFRTLIFANLAITAGMLVLVYRRFLAAADRLTATMICLAIVLVFAFQHYVPVGNYNYVTPYCHEVFHGLVLSLVVVMWLSDWVEKERIQFARGGRLWLRPGVSDQTGCFPGVDGLRGGGFFCRVFFTGEPVLRQNHWWHFCWPG